MLALIKKSIYNNRKKLFIYIVLSLLMLWMFAAFYPAVRDEAEDMTKLFEAYPEELFQAFGVEGTDVFSTFEAFLGVEHFSIMWPILVIILTISLGTSAIAGEIDDKTIEILLSQPMSRTKIYIAKYVSSTVIILVFNFVSILAIFPFAKIYNIELATENYFTLLILCILLSMSLFSISIMFSSYFSTKGLPTSTATGLVIIMYALNMLSTFQKSVEKVKYLSFFYYFDYNLALKSNQIELVSILVFAGTIIISSIAGLVHFKKRDIAT